MTTPYEALRGDVFAQVGNHLGDTISALLVGGATVTLLGFLTNDADSAGADGISPARNLWHAKIDKTPENVALLPAGPASIKRLTAPVLPTVYRPAADTIDDNGGAWLFDLQVARA